MDALNTSKRSGINHGGSGDASFDDWPGNKIILQETETEPHPEPEKVTHILLETCSLPLHGVGRLSLSRSLSMRIPTDEVVHQLTFHSRVASSCGVDT